jgi:hypothetical protein
MTSTCSTQSLPQQPKSTKTRRRYQEGSISRVKRAKGPDVWIFRWRERQPDGSLKQKKTLLGDAERYPRLLDAKQAAEDLRADINRGPQVTEMNVRELWHHFWRNELEPNEIERSPVTVQVLQGELSCPHSAAMGQYSPVGYQGCQGRTMVEVASICSGYKMQIQESIILLVFSCHPLGTVPGRKPHPGSSPVIAASEHPGHSYAR